MEGCCDYFRAYAETEDESFQLGSWNDDDEGWREVNFDATELAGQRFRLRFTFSSDSSVTYPGVWVDDIVLASTCAPRGPARTTQSAGAPTASTVSARTGAACTRRKTSAARATPSATTPTCAPRTAAYPGPATPTGRTRRAAAPRTRTATTAIPARPRAARTTSVCSPATPTPRPVRAAVWPTRTATTETTCTEDLCVARRCENPWRCCTVDADCDDGELCTQGQLRRRRPVPQHARISRPRAAARRRRSLSTSRAARCRASPSAPRARGGDIWQVVGASSDATPHGGELRPVLRAPTAATETARAARRRAPGSPCRRTRSSRSASGS